MGQAVGSGSSWQEHCGKEPGLGGPECQAQPGSEPSAHLVATERRWEWTWSLNLDRLRTAGALGAAVEQVTDYHVQDEWREAEDGRQADRLGLLLSREAMP